MKESQIERWLCDQVRAMGGICDKYTSPSNPGVPDRIIIMPGGRVIFAELKTEIGCLSGIQKWQRTRYAGVGADVRLVKGMKGARELVEELKRERRMTDEVHTP